MKLFTPKGISLNRFDSKEDIPLISVPDIKLIFAKKLQNNLNSDEGLINATMEWLDISKENKILIGILKCQSRSSD